LKCRLKGGLGWALRNQVLDEGPGQRSPTRKDNFWNGVVVRPTEKHWNIALTKSTVASKLLPFGNNVESRLFAVSQQQQLDAACFLTEGVAWSVSVSVCRLVTFVSSAIMAGQIEVCLAG